MSGFVNFWTFQFGRRWKEGGKPLPINRPKKALPSPILRFQTIDQALTNDDNGPKIAAMYLSRHYRPEASGVIFSLKCWPSSH
jgi:hypothetical protein